LTVGLQLNIRSDREISSLVRLGLDAPPESLDEAYRCAPNASDDCSTRHRGRSARQYEYFCCNNQLAAARHQRSSGHFAVPTVEKKFKRFIAR
jgi:hypothetical protein